MVVERGRVTYRGATGFEKMRITHGCDARHHKRKHRIRRVGWILQKMLSWLTCFRLVGANCVKSKETFRCSYKTKEERKSTCTHLILMQEQTKGI